MKTGLGLWEVWLPTGVLSTSRPVYANDEYHWNNTFVYSMWTFLASEDDG